MTHESWQDPPAGYRDSIAYNAAMNARDFDNQDREPLEGEPLNGPVDMSALSRPLDELNGQPMPATEYGLARWAIANKGKVKEYDEIAAILAAVDIAGPDWPELSPLSQVKALIELYGGSHGAK